MPVCNNPHGIPDADIDVEFYASQSWNKLFPTAWADIVKTKPDVAEMHRKHIRGMITTNCNAQYSITVVSNGRIGWKALDDKDREFQVQLAGTLRTIIQNRMKGH